MSAAPLNLHDVGALAAKFQAIKEASVKQTTIHKFAIEKGDKALAEGKDPFKAYDDFMEMVGDCLDTAYNINPFNPYACEVGDDKEDDDDNDEENAIPSGPLLLMCEEGALSFCVLSASYCAQGTTYNLKDGKLVKVDSYYTIESQRVPMERMLEPAGLGKVLLISNWPDKYRCLDFTGLTNVQAIERIGTFYRHKTIRRMIGDHTQFEGFQPHTDETTGEKMHRIILGS